ncbi:MAG: MATE family efflux transporter [Vampirovibrionia bacterium]
MEIDRKLFLEEKVTRLLLKFSTPAVLGMSVIAIATISDSIFVGKLVGTAGLAATTLALPVYMLLSAIAGTIGIGGSSIWSVDMGAKNYDRAERVFGNVMILNFIVGLCIMLFGLLFIDNLLAFMNTPADVYSYAKVYVGFIFLGSFFTICTIGFNNFIRAEGKPVTSMIFVITAGTITVLLDAVLIYYFKMGIKGAAIAAISGHFIVFWFVLYHFTRGNSALKIKKEMFIPDFGIIKEVFLIGMASFLRQFSIGVMHFIINISVVWYSGLKAGIMLAVVGIAFRIIMFILMPVIGIIQGMQPIVGFNYGAKEYLRAKNTTLVAMCVSFTIAFVLWLISFSFPGYVLGIFSNDNELIESGSNIVRLIIFFIPLVAAQTTGAGVFQALKKPLPANFFAALRQIILLVPLILILPRFIGLEGVWYAVPVADLVAVIITFIWIIREFRVLDREHMKIA